MAFLYTQPPAELKFYPHTRGWFSARGAIVVMSKEKGEQPELEFHRFEFGLKPKNQIIEKAIFILEKLENLHQLTSGDELPTWKEQRGAYNDWAKKVSTDYTSENNNFVFENAKLLHSWDVSVNELFENIKDIDDLKKRFGYAFQHEEVVRHYFETTWNVLSSSDPLQMNFKGVYNL